MKSYTKNNYIFSTKDAFECSPHFVNQTAAFDCLNCGRTMNVVVPNEFIDWESIANDYKTMYEQSLSRFSEVMQDMDVMYGAENPAATYFRNKILMIKLQIEKEIRDGKWNK